jgi:hypothetical protein
MLILVGCTGAPAPSRSGGDHEADPAQGARRTGSKQLRHPAVEQGFGLRPWRGGPGRRARQAIEDRQQPMRQRDAGARRTRDLDIGWRRFAVRDGFECRAGADVVAHRHVVH